MAERPGVIRALQRKVKAMESAGLDASHIRARLEISAVPDSELGAQTESIVHVGGGWYQVGDEKVQGREAAEALAKEQ